MKGLTTGLTAMVVLLSCRSHIPRLFQAKYKSFARSGRLLSTAVLNSSPRVEATATTRFFCSEPFFTTINASSVTSNQPSLFQELSVLSNYTGSFHDGRTKEQLQHIMGKFHRDEKLSKEYMLKLLDHSIETSKMMPNVIEVNRSQSPTSTAEQVQYTSNLTVVGDVHGQYADFATIFEDEKLGDYPSASNQFIFNGDLVDRGSKAVEIVTTLLLAKALVPSAVHLLRGNHETAAMYENYGFAQEVLRKYDFEVLDKFRELFDALPVAAVVENAVFVTHGGIGPQSVNMKIADINALNRFEEPGFDSAIAELLWSDPRDKMSGFKVNRGRGGGICFGADVTEAFLARNGLQLLIRSHEVCMEGFDVLHNNLCVTVFSAPNYCGNVGNYGAVIRFDFPDSMMPKVLQFEWAALIKATKAKAEMHAKQRPTEQEQEQQGSRDREGKSDSSGSSPPPQ